MEQWALCNTAIRPELAAVDRLLAKYGHAACPRGGPRDMKHSHMEFRETSESPLATLLTPIKWSTSYSPTFLSVMSLEERLSFADFRANVIWVGSDATPTTCAAVDHYRRLYTIFDYQKCIGYLTNLTGIPPGDFQLIALAEYMSLICFLIKVADRYMGQTGHLRWG